MSGMAILGDTLWFDVEKRSKTIDGAIACIAVALWFDVERR